VRISGYLLGNGSVSSTAYICGKVLIKFWFTHANLNSQRSIND